VLCKAKARLANPRIEAKITDACISLHLICQSAGRGEGMGLSDRTKGC
jgi:hypothetical protein